MKSKKPYWPNPGHGRWITQQGYIQVQKTENKTDNRIENLQLHQSKHGSGIIMQCSECGSYNVEAVEA